MASNPLNPVMAGICSLKFTHDLGIRRNHGYAKQFKVQDFWSIRVSNRMYRPIHLLSYRYNVFKCHSLLVPGKYFEISRKTTAMALTRSYNALQGNPVVHKMVPALGIIIFAVWILGPLLRQGRNVFLHKSDSSWRTSGTYYVLTSYLQPLMLWTGAILICRALESVVPPSDAGQIVKQRLLNFVGSLSTVLAFAYCLSSVIQQAQKFFMETNDSSDAKNMGFQFAGKAIYSAVWVAAVSLFMELLGFSTQKWLTAGGLGTVLLTLAGREIFTNFLSSAMIHATRPFVVNEWIQTKIEGYEVSGTVEHVGWWSPTIIRGEDREAVHIPNHKFTMNVVRNLSQKTHWRIKTHLAISHLDVNKINSIVADMRKVLAKSPHVEQQRLHRRVFLDIIEPENQALSILVSCFVKTSHFEEYLCVKEAILLDLLRVISHHRARLATPIRTVQKIYSDTDLENIPFADTIFPRGAVSNRPLMLIEPPYWINGDDKTKTRPLRTGGEQDSKATARLTPDNIKTESKSVATSMTDLKSKETPAESKVDVKTVEISSSDKGNKAMVTAASMSDPKEGEKLNVPTSKPFPRTDAKDLEVSSSDSKVQGLASDSLLQNVSDKQHKKASSGNVKVGSPVSVLESFDDKPGSSLATAEPKQEAERPNLRPALEENIVLGVALEGSRRTLPIEEVAGCPPAEAKEFAASEPFESDKKDGQLPAVPSVGDCTKVD